MHHVCILCTHSSDIIILNIYMFEICVQVSEKYISECGRNNIIGYTRTE